MSGLNLPGACIDTLVALVEEGPLWDGNVPSKRGRDELIDLGLAVRVVANTPRDGWSDGYVAATYAGRDAYKAYFGQSDTMKEARSLRIARRELRSAEFRTRGPDAAPEVPRG